MKHHHCLYYGFDNLLIIKRKSALLELKAWVGQLGFKNIIFIAHNSQGSEEKSLRLAAKEDGFRIPKNWFFVCSLKIIKNICNFKKNSIQDLANQLKININGKLHDASTDVIVLLNIFIKIFKEQKFAIDDPLNFINFIDFVDHISTNEKITLSPTELKKKTRNNKRSNEDMFLDKLKKEKETILLYYSE